MLRLEAVGDIQVIRLDRPPVNALNTALLVALDQSVRAAPSAGYRGIMLTGVAQCYCAGLDLRELVQADAAGLEHFLGAFLDCLQAIAVSPVPIVAAINGHSPAGGAVIALHCDRRVMRDGDTKIGLNEVAVGLCPGELIHTVLTRTVGARHAAEMLTSGAMLTAAEALQIGLVDQVVAQDAVESTALDWLRRRLALPAHAYQTTRRLVRRDLVALLSEATGPHRATTLSALQRDWQQEDTRAVLQSLLQRRG